MVKWAGYVRGTGDVISTTKTLFREPEEKETLWRLDVDDGIIRVLQYAITKWDMRMKTGSVFPQNQTPVSMVRDFSIL
jgi:hypothetical protein